ncbi:MAG TPA: hypothetical protein VFA67_08160 [Candidatus Sulfotelmatobacter sp.]|nr:hypothetical protein [Candidatus Sulfotelmatobacter sp.]
MKRYAAVEPRAGLEDRIFAHLRREGHAPSSLRWRWGVAAAAVAALAVIITMASRPHPIPHPTFAQHASVSLPSPDLAGASQPRPAINRVQHRSYAGGGTQVAKAVPKLDQFPSHQPLSEQEKLLASYVEVYPKQAALLARLRTEEVERERIQERSQPASKDAADFDQE